MDTKKVELIKALIANAETNILQAKNILNQLLGEEIEDENSRISKNGKVNGKLSLADLNVSEDGKVIEGVFDGESMIGSDRKKYSVPPNYASKSKLVYGDRLKLIIGSDGSFTYKQIGPIERKYTTGVLIQDAKVFKVAVGDKQYRVLAASVSYYRAQAGDEVAVIVPSEIESDWATIDNIIPKGSATSPSQRFEETSRERDSSEEGIGSPFEIPKTLFSRKKTVIK